MISLLALIILGRGLVLLPAFNPHEAAVPYAIMTHWAATPQDTDKPGHFSGDSRRFTSLMFKILGRCALSILSLRVSRRLQHALEWLVQLTHLILAESVCRDTIFLLFRIALAIDHWVLIMDFQGHQEVNSP
jgi:hypothetical protein